MTEDNGKTRYQKKPTTLVGLISAVSIRATDRGKMASITLDDKTGYYEFRIFDKNIELFEHLLVKEEILVVEGTLNTVYGTNDVRFYANILHNIEDARNQFLRRLQLTIHKSQATNGLLDELDQLLPTRIQNKEEQQQSTDQMQVGNCPVFVKYETDSEIAELRLGSDVSAPLADDDIKRLRKILGEDKVHLIY